MNSYKLSFIITFIIVLTGTINSDIELFAASITTFVVSSLVAVCVFLDIGPDVNIIILTIILFHSLISSCPTKDSSV